MGKILVFTRKFTKTLLEKLWPKIKQLVVEQFVPLLS